jgi:hypothetical protein
MNFLLLGALGRMNMILKCLTIGIVGQLYFCVSSFGFSFGQVLFQVCLLNIKGISILFQHATTVR